MLYHSVTSKCASADETGTKAVLKSCDSTDFKQQWSWENIDEEKLKKFNSNLHSAVS